MSPCPSPAPITEVNAIIRNTEKIGIDEMQNVIWDRLTGKVRVHDGIGSVPRRLACSCEPWCGARYFPRVSSFRELRWMDVESLLRRVYGNFEFESWAKSMGDLKKIRLLEAKSMARKQGSDPLFPTFLPIPYIVENGLNHDFHEYLSAENPDLKERFRFLHIALAPLVLDAGLAPNGAR